MIEPRTPIRFIGGKYNGLKGTVLWMGDILASVVILMDGRAFDVVEEIRHLEPFPKGPVV